MLKQKRVEIKELYPVPKSEADIQALLDKCSNQLLISETTQDVVDDLFGIFDNRKDFVLEILDNFFTYYLMSKDSDAMSNEERNEYFYVYSRLHRLVRSFQFLSKDFLNQTISDHVKH